MKHLRVKTIFLKLNIRKVNNKNLKEQFKQIFNDKELFIYFIFKNHLNIIL